MAIVFPSGTLSGPTKILQVLETRYSTRTDVSLTSGGNISLPFSQAITPSSTSSKIIIDIHVSGEFGSTAAKYKAQLGIKRGITTLNAFSDQANRAAGYSPFADNYHNDVANTMEWCQIFYMDSPNTTSSVTYTPYIESQSGTFRINRTWSDANEISYAYSHSVIRLMEVAG